MTTKTGIRTKVVNSYRFKSQTCQPKSVHFREPHIGKSTSDIKKSISDLDFPMSDVNKIKFVFMKDSSYECDVAYKNDMKTIHILYECVTFEKENESNLI